ncbi:MAG: hypothetical protein JSW50_04940 [Candidatus Latescibacterota bacterium]|nr:MAG: hypothetical protein JSW50_04940 [Candidatus Latescibacterota bacterium]
MDIKLFFLCFGVSTVLMLIFVAINYPYYRMAYGDRTKAILTRTILLNTLAIAIGWAPVVVLWPEFSKKFALPCASALGAIGGVGSRFIYPEIVPEELAKALVKLIERESRGNS